MLFHLQAPQLVEVLDCRLNTLGLNALKYTIAITLYDIFFGMFEVYMSSANNFYTLSNTGSKHLQQT